MPIVVAQHENGVCFHKLSKYFFGTQDALIVSTPKHLFECSEEHLENGIKLWVCKCPFFDGHLGIANSEWKSTIHAIKTLESVFSKLIEAKTFLSYLRNKDFQVAKTLSGFRGLKVQILLK